MDKRLFAIGIQTYGLAPIAIKRGAEHVVVYMILFQNALGILLQGNNTILNEPQLQFSGNAFG